MTPIIPRNAPLILGLLVNLIRDDDIQAVLASIDIDRLGLHGATHRSLEYRPRANMTLLHSG